MNKFFLNIKLLIVLFFAVFLSNTNAQNVNLRFQHIDVKDGLSQNMITSITQDSIGFLWFGTKDGLNRYDGYSFKVFRNNINDSTTISDNHITCLLFDSYGNLWVGTQAGLNIYNQEKETFNKVVLENDDEKSVSNIYRIVEKSKNSIWIETRQSKLYKISLKDKKNEIIPIKNLFAEEVIIENSKDFYINDFTFDKHNNFWLGTKDGVFKANYDKTSNVVSLMKISGIKTETILATKNSLWIGDRGKISKINLQNPQKMAKTYNLFDLNSNAEKWLFSVKDIKNVEDSLLIISTAHGLVLFNIKNESFINIVSSIYNRYSLSDNNILTSFIDKSQNLWLGTSGFGINKTNLISNKFEYYPASANNKLSSSILLIKEDFVKSIWFTNMNSILHKLNEQNGEAKEINFSSKISKYFYDFFPMPDNTFWSLKNYQLEKINISQNRIDIFNCNEYRTANKEFQRIIAVDEQFVWIASTSSIVSFEIKKQKFTSFPFPFDEEVKVISILNDDNINFWIGTSNGLLNFNKLTKNWDNFYRTINGLSNERIKSICADPYKPNSVMWVGTDGGGLNKIDLQSKKVEIFTSNDGLPNDVVYGILTDKNNNLWLSTNNGLSCFNPLTKTFRNYNIYDGLQDNEFNSQAYYKTNDGKLYFGGIKGITAFYPDKLSVNKSIPKIFLTGFKLFNKDVTPSTENSPLTKMIGFLDKIELSYNQNSFSLEFTSMDFTESKNNLYKYKLENFDDHWTFNGKSREAFYTNIPPGEYIFRAIGSNNDQIWNESGSSIRIIINPPFWLTWWAYVIYALIFIYVIYIIDKFQRNKLNLKKKIEINEIERQKYQEINNLKSRFLTNISHEFRTPLTLIIGPIEELLLSIKDKKIRKTLELIKNNSNQLLHLVNQLLELAKLEKEKFPIRNTRNELVKFMLDYLNSVISLATQKGISLEFISTKEEISAHFDSDIFHKIISNLITNSIKFTPENGKIKLNLIYEPTHSDKIIIAIEDNGIGIKHEDLKNIFNPFFRGDTIKEFSQDGFGIGLSLTKELVELLNGKIDVESIPNQKTLFTLVIPLIVDETFGEEYKIVFNHQEIGELNENTSISNGLNNTNFDDKIVLVIEDVAEMRNYISEIIETDFKVIKAENGIEGFDKAKEFVPDLIISDVMMPKISGFELVANLKSDELTSHIPVILLTAKVDDESKLNGLEIGADDYLLKPFNSQELKIRIKNLINSREKLKQKFANDSFEISNDLVKSQNEVFISKINNFIQKNIANEKLTVDDIAKFMHLSYSQVYRKIKAITNQTGVQFILSYRLKRASELLRKNAGNVAEIAFMVGFQSPSYFTQCFKKEFNSTPIEFVELHKNEN